MSDDLYPPESFDIDTFGCILVEPPKNPVSSTLYFIVWPKRHGRPPSCTPSFKDAAERLVLSWEGKEYSLCFTHYEHEEVTDSTFLVCGECGHVFPTTADLEQALFERWDEKRPASEILSCPLCVHDF